MDLVDLGPGKLDPKTNALLLQAKGIDHSDGDAPDYGNVVNMGALGLTAIPYQADKTGKCQGIVEQLDGGISVCFGARDTRCAKIVGNGRPGDTIVHSTGPQQAAQLQLKEEKRQAVLLTKDTRGNTAAVMLDGKNDKYQVAAFGHMIEVSRDGISLATDGGAKILMQGDRIYFLATCVFGGMAPIGPVLWGPAPVIGGVGGLGTPAFGVFIGK